ncbi:type III PLP-dependent enzyme [Streptomyces sp. NPDC004237]|uniref:type III PLP-dependent enzyme n=1 Tax=Streptomyces sp. NPDC004237 TaxID=3154455 RepID=UPI0033B3E654
MTTFTARPPLSEFIARGDQPTPYTAFSIDTALDAYRRLTVRFPGEVWFAIKAAPVPGLLSALGGLGCGFDVASPAEARMCLHSGVPAATISYGNPVRSAGEIEAAAALGVRTFVVDTELEVRRLASMVPGVRVVIRLAHGGEGSDWPLSYRYGCTRQQALLLARKADRLGLDVAGLCWHVGSQQRDRHAWDAPVAAAAALWNDLARDGIHLRLLNVGGGLPADCYQRPAPPMEEVVDAILAAVDRHFADRPVLVVEPGRALTAAAGVSVVEVKAIADRVDGRYVVVDGGVFNLGLIEAAAVGYRIDALGHTDPGDEESMPVIISGPSCDSVDVLPAPYHVPKSLRVGDQLAIWGTGAYTWPYAANDFNGYAPVSPVLVSS